MYSSCTAPEGVDGLQPQLAFLRRVYSPNEDYVPTLLSSKRCGYVEDVYYTCGNNLIRYFGGFDQGPL